MKSRFLFFQTVVTKKAFGKVKRKFGQKQKRTKLNKKADGFIMEIYSKIIIIIKN